MFDRDNNISGLITCYVLPKTLVKVNNLFHIIK